MNRKIRSFFKVGLPILLVFLAGVFLSYKVFKTIGDGSELNSVYYIFSTGAQTIAGLVGFVLAAYTFNYQLMRNARDNNEGTSEIIDKAIKSYYRYIVILSVSTGITLIFDLFVLELNKLKNIAMKPNAYILVGSMNIVIIIATFIIALYILRPINIEDWAKKLLEERPKRKDGNLEQTTDIGDFIKAYIELEQICRNSVNIPSLTSNNNFMGMSRIARELVSRGIIDKETFGRLLEITQYRNLVVHGHLDKVENEMFENLKDLLQDLKNRLLLR